MEGTKIVSSAILGYDVKTIFVADKAYTIKPPTIHALSGASYWLSSLPEAKSISEMLRMFVESSSLAKALSFFIVGDESLADDLMAGTPDELINGIEIGFGLVSTANFTRLSDLRRSARTLIAKPNT